MSFKLEIVTPEKPIFSDEVDLVVLPGVEGELGVLAQHTALVTTLAPGELRCTKEGVETEFAVGEGLIEVTGTTVSVLTDLVAPDLVIDIIKSR